MGLLSSFRRRDDAAASAAAAPGDAAAIRQRAKRRLIGASVLLAIGVIGFPLLFETQPRPIPVDIPIEIPRKDNAPPLTLPGRRPPPPTVATPVDPAPGAEAASAADPRPATQAASAAMAGARPASAGPAKSTTSTATAQGGIAASKDAAAATATATARNASSPPRGDDGRRAQALLEGRPAQDAVRASEASGLRLVVQVGAYAEADKLRATRQKVEQLGMKTYTQVVEVDGASRTRVRVGPFASRHEAEQAAARIKATGLPAAVLAL